MAACPAQAATDARGLTTAPADSLKTAPSSPVDQDSLAVPQAVPAEDPRLCWWRQDYGLDLLGVRPGEAIVSRTALNRSGAMYLSDALECEGGLGLFAAGSPGAYETPYRLSPGTDRLAVWSGGLATSGAGLPEGLVHSLSPLSVHDLYFLNPDPVLDVLADGSDGSLYGSWPRTAGPETPSAFRLTEGPYGAGTEDVILARRAGMWGLQASYAHARARGRYLYGTSKFQNLSLALDRAGGWGGWQVRAAGRHGQSQIDGHRKLLWEADLLSAGGQILSQEAWDVQVMLTRRNDLTRWWTPQENVRRRTTSTAGIAQGRWELNGGGDVIAALGVDHTTMSYWRRGERTEDWSRGGMGLAMGWVGPLGPLACLASLGYADPWWHAGHLRWHLRLEHAPASRWGGAVEAWSGGTQAFVPRAEPDGVALLQRGLFYPAGESAEGQALRRVTQIEGTLRLESGRLRLRAGPLWRQILQGVGLRSDRAADLRPEIRESLPVAELVDDLDQWSWVAAVQIALPLSLSLSGDGIIVLAPSAAERLALFQARERGRIMLAAQGWLFKGDLWWELRGAMFHTGPRQSPYGRLPASARVDLEGRGRIRDASFFLALRNVLADPNAPEEWGESATYDDGWMPVPGRGYRMGIEWHFLD